MLRTFIWLLCAAATGIITLPLGWLLRLIARPERGDKLFSIEKKLMTLTVRVFARIAGFRLECTGKENLPQGAALYVGNHQGYFDVAASLLCFGIHGFIAKKEISRVPIARMWLKNIGCIFIDRSDLRKSLQTMKQAEEYLKSGKSLTIFPEGTRSRGGDIKEFKPGSLRCAVKAGVPVVPFVIDGSYKAFEEKHRISPATVRLSILPPINTAEKKTADLSNEVEIEIRKEFEKIRSIG